MDDTILQRIIDASAALPIEEQGHFIAAQTIAAIRAADAAISDQAVEAEFKAWFAGEYGIPPSGPAVRSAISWGRHLLNRGRHG